MAKIKFYTDEHIPNAVGIGLRQRGVDVLTVPEAGMRGASDEDHLKRAWEEGRVFFTQDDDFLRLAAAGVDHAGIVFATQAHTIGTIISGLILIHEVLEADELIGHVEYLIRI